MPKSIIRPSSILAIFIALYILLVSCTPYDDTGPWIRFGDLTNAVQTRFPLRVAACGFDNVSTELIYQAVEEWNVILGETAFLASKEGCLHHFWSDLVFQPGGAREDSVVAMIFTWHCEDNLCPNVLSHVYDRWHGHSPWVKRLVIKHEIGHYLGLGHGFEPGCLMNLGNFREEIGLCKEEMRALCAHYPGFQNCR